MTDMGMGLFGKKAVGIGVVAGIATLGLGPSISSAADKTGMAETFFNKGIAYMEKEQYAAACPLLEESYRRDPLLGALIALADCEYERGRLSSAFNRYQEYVGRHDNLADAARVKQGSRLREAQARVAELKPAVPKLEVTVPPEAKTPILYLDGLRIKPNEEYSLNPGIYEITLDVFGRETYRVYADVKKGQKKVVAMDLGRPLPPPIKRVIPVASTADDIEETRGTPWKVGITLMSAGLLGYVSVFFTSGPLTNGGVPGSTISVALGTTLTFGGAVLTLPRKVATQTAILPLLQVGKGPEQPTMIGFQGRF